MPLTPEQIHYGFTNNLSQDESLVAPIARGFRVNAVNSANLLRSQAR